MLNDKNYNINGVNPDTKSIFREKNIELLNNEMVLRLAHLAILDEFTVLEYNMGFNYDATMFLLHNLDIKIDPVSFYNLFCLRVKSELNLDDDAARDLFKMTIQNHSPFLKKIISESDLNIF